MGWTDSHLHECLAKLRPPGFWSQGGVVGEHDGQHDGLNDEDGPLGAYGPPTSTAPTHPPRPPMQRRAGPHMSVLGSHRRSPWGRFGFRFRPSVNHQRMGTHAQ